MKENTDFLNESEEFLKPFGFSLSFHTDIGNKNFMCGFIQEGISCSCNIENGTRYMELISEPLKMFITLQSGKFQYKHPNFSRYLEFMNNYVKVCKGYNVEADEPPPLRLIKHRKD